MTLQIRHLRLAVCLRSASSLNRAAKELGVTQPTASRILAEIERHISVTVLERTPRGSALTPAGEAFAARAAETLDSFDALVDPARWRQDSLTIAYAWGGLETAMTEAVRQWHQAHPRGSCRMRQHDDPLGALTSGAADLALLRGSMDLPRLATCVLYTESRVVVLPQDSPLADRPSLGRADLQDMEFVVNADSGTGEELRFGASSAPPATEVHGVDEWIVAIAARSDRFGITPESTMSYYSHPRLVVRPVADLPDIPLRLAWREDEGRASIREFIALLKDAA